MFFLAAILSQYSFFQVARNKFGGFNYTNSNLAGIVWTSALFLFGPIGVWVQVLLNLLFYAVRFPRGVQSRYRLNWFRNVVFNSGVGILISLLTVSFYQWLDGPIPLTDLSLGTFLRALIAMVIFIPAPGLFFQSYVFFVEKIDLGTKKWQSEYREMTRQTSIFIILSEIPSLFGILAAAIFSQMG